MQISAAESIVMQALWRSSPLAAEEVTAAVAAGQEADLGSLSAGKLADFVVLPYELKEADPLAVPDCKPVATYSGAQCVYAGPDWGVAG